MKRFTLIIVFVIAIMLILLSCQSNVEESAVISNEGSGESSMILSSSEVSENDESVHSELNVESDCENGSAVESESSTQNENSDEDSNESPNKNSPTYPLLFIDTTDNISDKAYIICAFNEEGAYATNEFLYSDKNLGDYIEAQGVIVESDIIDTSNSITFYDKNGISFDSYCGKISCYGEPIIYETHVCADVNSDMPSSGLRFWGTYSELDIYPDEIEYGENSIVVDLDSDGAEDIIRWSFYPAEDDWREEEYYRYTLESVIDGKTIAISDNREWLPLKKTDFEVFVADIDLDGVFEVLVYEKAVSRFNNIFIYDIGSDKSEVLHFYTISPEP